MSTIIYRPQLLPKQIYLQRYTSQIAAAEILTARANSTILGITEILFAFASEFRMSKYRYIYRRKTGELSHCVNNGGIISNVKWAGWHDGHEIIVGLGNSIPARPGAQQPAIRRS